MENGNGLWYNLDLINILLLFLSVVLIWLKKSMNGEFDAVKTNLNNLNDNLNQVNTNVSNFHKNDQNQNIHIYNIPEVIKTNLEEIQEDSKTK